MYKVNGSTIMIVIITLIIAFPVFMFIIPCTMDEIGYERDRGFVLENEVPVVHPEHLEVIRKVFKEYDCDIISIFRTEASDITAVYDDSNYDVTVIQRCRGGVDFRVVYSLCMKGRTVFSCNEKSAVCIDYCLEIK